MLDLLPQLAKSPTTPPGVLDLLTQFALTADPGDAARRTLPFALLENPALSDTSTRALLGVRSGRDRFVDLDALMRRPGLTALHLLELLAPDHSATTLQYVLHAFEDPTGLLARTAMDASPGRMVWAVVARHASNPLPLRQEAARGLATCGTKLTVVATRFATQVARDTLRHGAATGTLPDAVAWVDDLRAMCTSDALTSRLAELRAMADAAVGTKAWLQDPTRAHEDVLAWAKVASTKSAWARATAWHYDPTATIATAAMDAFGDTRDVASAVIVHPWLPTALRLAALHTLHDVAPTQARSHEYDILAECSPTTAVTYMKDTGMSPHLVMRRDDLTSEHLYAATVAIIASCVRDLPRAAGPWWLGTHPQATSGQRRWAAEQLRSMPGLFADLFERAATVIDTLDAHGLAAAGSLLDSELAARFIDVYGPSTTRLLAAALDGLLPRDLDANTVRVLAALSASFPGTVGDLVTTTAAIAA